MGEIRVSDGADDTRFVTAHLDGSIELHVRDGRPRLVVPADSTVAAGDVEVVEGEVAPRRRLVTTPWWSLSLAPLLAGIYLLGASLDLFARVPGSAAADVETVVAAATVLVAWVGTYVVCRDAEDLRAADAPWQPTAWHYVGSGGAVTAGYLLWTLGTLPFGPALVPVVVGACVVGVGTASAVTGPLYLHRRRRRVGVD